MLKQLLWVSCVFLAAACGGGGGGVAVDDLLDEVEASQCDYLVRCELVQDRATCDAAVTVESGFLNTTLEAVERGTVEYDAGAAQKCVDEIAKQGCEFDGFHTGDPCEDVFKGTVAPGGQCFVSLECANQGDCEQNDQTCDPDVTCCPGTCVAGPTESAIGGPCADDLHYCALNSYCKSSGTGTSTCAALIPTEGASCEEIDACANPMYCNIDFATGMGTCKKAPSTGAACSTEDLLDCSDRRDYCDATSKCVRAAAVGAACGPDVECVGYATCINAKCVADPKLGEACVVDGAQDCTGSLECTNNQCALPASGLSCPL